MEKPFNEIFQIGKNLKTLFVKKIVLCLALKCNQTSNDKK
jgi:predicted transposase YbfD/YdcC